MCSSAPPIRSVHRTLVEESEKAEDATVKNSYRDLFRLLTKVDRGVIEEAKRRYPEMAEAWMEIFATEIKEKEIRAAVDATRRYVSEEVAIQDVAQQFGVTAQAVREVLEKKEAVAV